MTWPVLPDRIVVVPFDDAVVLVDTAVGAAHRLVGTSALVMRWRDELAGLDDAVTMVAGALDADRTIVAADLVAFETTLGALTTPAPSAPPIEPRPAIGAPSRPPIVSWTLDLLGEFVSVRCYDRELAPLVGAALADLAAPADQPARGAPVEVWAEDGALTVEHDGHRWADRDDIELGLSRLISGLTVLASRVDPDAVVLHAAGLERDGRGIVVVGASGQGKSSTTLTLVRRGAGFLSDELVRVDVDAFQLRGLPRPIGVVGAIREHHRDLRPDWVPRVGDARRWTIPAGTIGTVRASASWSATVLLDYDTAHPVGLAPIAVSELFGRLVPQLYTLDTISAARLATFATALARVPASVLHHHGAPSAAAALDGWWQTEAGG